MRTVKSSDHIRTSQQIKGFRSCPHSTGISFQEHDRIRILLREGERIFNDQTRRRRWQIDQWSRYCKRIM